MQFKLITIIETIIDASEHSPSYEDAKGEILGRLTTYAEDVDVTEGVKSAHNEAVVFDSVRAQSVTHSFEEVK